jgi:hypothetical protein
VKKLDKAERLQYAGAVIATTEQVTAATVTAPATGPQDTEPITAPQDTDCEDTAAFAAPHDSDSEAANNAAIERLAAELALRRARAQRIISDRLENVPTFLLDESEFVGTTTTMHYFYFGTVPVGCKKEQDTALLKLEMHRLFVVPPAPPRMRCPYCGRWAISQLNMWLHMSKSGCMDMPDPTTGIQSQQHICMPVHLVNPDVLKALRRTTLPQSGRFDIVDVNSIPIRSDGINKAVAKVRHYEMVCLKTAGSSVRNLWTLAASKKKGKFREREDLPFW